MSKRFGRKKKRLAVEWLNYERYRINELNRLLRDSMLLTNRALGIHDKALGAPHDAMQFDLKILDMRAKQIFG